MQWAARVSNMQIIAALVEADRLCLFYVNGQGQNVLHLLVQEGRAQVCKQGVVVDGGVAHSNGGAASTSL